MYELAKNLVMRCSSDGSTYYQPLTGKAINVNERGSNLLKLLCDTKNLSPFNRAQRSFLSSLTADFVRRGILVPANVTSLEKHLRSLEPFKKSSQGFFGAKMRDIAELPAAPHLAIFGVPYDLGAKKPGTRFGPAHLREASLRMIFRGTAYNLDTQEDFLTSSLLDLGDLECPRASLDDCLASLQKAASWLPELSVPLMVGGDHTFTLPLIQSLFLRRQQKPFVVVQIDSHLDLQLWGELTDEGPKDLDPPTHGNFLSHVLRDCPGTRLLQLGAKHWQSMGSGTQASVKSYLRHAGIQRSDFAVQSGTLESIFALLPQDQDVYLTIDVDALRCISHTGYPNPFGIDPRRLIEIIKALIANNRIVGADLMEFGSSSEHDGHKAEAEVGAIILATLIQEIGRKIHPAICAEGK